MVLWCCLLCTTLSGCTLVGTGVGLGVVLAVPGPYEKYHVPAPQGFTRQRFLAEVRVSKGDRIAVKRTDGIVSTGKYRGLTPDLNASPSRDTGRRPGTPRPAPLPPGIIVEMPERTAVILLREVVAVDVVAEPIGYYWLIGTGVGLVLDALVFSALSALANTPL